MVEDLLGRADSFANMVNFITSMIVVRDEQMRAFEEARLLQWLTGYLESCYPMQCEELGTARLRELVTVASTRARKRGLERASEIRKYVHVNFLLGQEFETADRTRWALRILDDEEQEDVFERVCALEEAILARVEAGEAI